jgi:hypothetical protein
MSAAPQLGYGLTSPAMAARVVKSPLDRVRAVCLSFPETSERLSHGAPTFFVRSKHAFVMYLDNHHGDARLALWLASTRDMQSMLVEAEPNHYFVPPYVGPSGWLGVRLDKRVAFAKVAGLIEQAYLQRTSVLPQRRRRSA